jgi:cob(I)alamin adenosyltransferase
MLYTKKGDDGKTKIFGCDQRLSKSSAIAEALGTLDEINSFLGIIKSRGNQGQALSLQKGPTLISLVQEIQENLFTIQAEVAGADKKLGENKVSEMENLIGEIEKELPPIKNFLISGSTEMSALFDFARTLSRRAERRVVAVSEENLVKIDKEALAYLNRLSSLLFALARFFSKEAGVKEDSPKYK